MLHASLIALHRHPAHAPDLSLEQWAEVSVVAEMIQEAQALALAKALAPFFTALAHGLGGKKR